MIIDCISDLHGCYPELEGGDLLIVAGDLTASDTPFEYAEFDLWVHKQLYTHKIIISGNHDNFIEKRPYNIRLFHDENTHYLCDSGTEFEGLKIWGSPWTKKFPGMNPKAMAFTVDTEEELEEKWIDIPSDADILITHSPPFGIFDNPDCDCVGSKGLLVRSLEIKPLLHVFGHIHEHGGSLLNLKRGYRNNRWDKRWTVYANASHVNEHYEPVNKPIRIEL